ncbi:hypothetical protein AMAG_14015 [Allomyces macrogynus ATCC 38327]|uniref:EH domain-containing protein n=1 Tax=Allomyces macrogynus (strain ATCC 38327) TaxID=578462 RepID=A0A0L0T357_ALLM3|nr:hypothetical protein AMAG_14015 [Allomyces macrogynus ATCC 38327]|eukprot:KNE69161.1 hypothetical protein AMAG_14015 [Allomyces macrogynus ATCC 38327]
MAAVSVKDRIALFSTRAASDTGPPPTTTASPPTSSSNAPAAVSPPWRTPASVAPSRFSTPDKDPDHVAEPSSSASSSDDEAAHPHGAHDAGPPRLPLRRAPPPIAPRPRTPHLTAKIEELALVRPPGVTAATAVDADAPQLPPPPPYHSPAPSAGGTSTSTTSRPPLPSKPRPTASKPAPDTPLPPPPLPPRAGRPVMPVPAIPPRIAGPRARSPPSRRRAKTPPPPPPPPMRGGRKPLVTSVSMGHLNAVAGVRRGGVGGVPPVPPVPARPAVAAAVVPANAEKPVVVAQMVRRGAVATPVVQATAAQVQTPPAHPRNPHPVRSPAPARPVAPSPGRQRAAVASAAAVAVNAMVRGRRRSGEKAQVHPAIVNKGMKDPLDLLLATVPADARKRYASVYERLANVGTVDEKVVVALWRMSKLPLETLAEVWDAVTPRFGRAWTEREFAGGLWLIDAVLAGRRVKDVLARAAGAV